MVKVDFVETSDVPKIMLAIFISQPDLPEAASPKKKIIQHILDQVWEQYQDMHKL